MPKKERPLPRPRTTPFGKRRRFEEEGSDAPLLADEMAMAMAHGKIDEFLKKQIPDNEHARKLAEMMMGMTGMAPPETGLPQAGNSPPEPSEEIVRAALSADMNSLKELLRKEHERRAGISDEEPVETPTLEAQPKTFYEKGSIDELIQMAAENHVSVDWLMARAIKVYVMEYRKNGRL